jgi:hypothetical protein
LNDEIEIGEIKMKMKNLKSFFVFAAFGVLLLAETSYVFAIQGVTRSTLVNSSRAIFSNTSSAVVQAQAGNVTQLNIAGDSISTHWAGFYGNISGNVTLQDSAGHVFYDWAQIGLPSGEVFASNTSSVNWSGISCANSTKVANIETSLGIVAADGDSVVKTYTGNTHPAFQVGGYSLSGCNATNAFGAAGRNSQLYYQVLLTDTTGNPVYTTLINSSATSFTGSNFDFELLVGESDAAGTTPMYFYIELD